MARIARFVVPDLPHHVTQRAGYGVTGVTVTLQNCHRNRVTARNRRNRVTAVTAA
jgi:hypothetical protein